MGELTGELKELPMRALLAAGFITYLSSASEDVRRRMLANWQDMTAVHGFDLRRFLSTESEQLTWKAEGLPSDELSMENALVILQVQTNLTLPSLLVVLRFSLLPLSMLYRLHLSLLIVHVSHLTHLSIVHVNIYFSIYHF